MTNIKKRRRANLSFDENSYLLNSKLITLFLRDSSSLDENEKIFIKQSYFKHGKEGILKIVTDNQILPFASHILRELDCDYHYWDSIHQKYIVRNTEIKSIVNNVFYEFNNFGCKSPTLTENFAVVLSSNSCIGCFCSGDVDISADIKEINKITECLNSIGFQSKEQPEKIGEYSGQSMQFYNKNLLENGFWINVIWKPVTRAFLVQDAYDLRLSKARLNAILVPDTNIRILDDDSLMYFCALHISAGHYFTLTPGTRLHVDIDRLARAKNINWQRIIEWEKQDNAGIRISTTLYISSQILKTPIPNLSYKKAFKNLRNKVLVKYLINQDNIIQHKSSLLRRLYIELASDDKNLFLNFMQRAFKTFYQKAILNK